MIGRLATDSNFEELPERAHWQTQRLTGGRELVQLHILPMRNLSRHEAKKRPQLLLRSPAKPSREGGEGDSQSAREEESERGALKVTYKRPPRLWGTDGPVMAEQSVFAACNVHPYHNPSPPSNVFLKTLGNKD